MYCSNCSKEIDNQAIVCPHCGIATQNYNKVGTVDDKGGFLWGLLGCCIPVVGLILFLVWKDTKPKTSKAAGIGALVNVIVIALFYVFIVVLGLGVGYSGF